MVAEPHTADYDVVDFLHTLVKECADIQATTPDWPVFRDAALDGGLSTDGAPVVVRVHARTDNLILRGVAEGVADRTPSTSSRRPPPRRNRVLPVDPDRAQPFVE